jgi:hypothetical protein
MSKEEAADIMMKIMKAIKDTMISGGTTVLVFGDAKITIEKSEE